MWATKEESINPGQGCGDVVWKANLYSERVQVGEQQQWEFQTHAVPQARCAASQDAEEGD